MHLVVEPAAKEHLAEVAALAAVIWRAHYPGLISTEQIEYMLARMYDAESMRRELEGGVSWFRVLADGAMRGFASVASVPSGEKPRCPFPTTVDSSPVTASTRRMR